jgi:hypothetical protein
MNEPLNAFVPISAPIQPPSAFVAYFNDQRFWTTVGQQTLLIVAIGAEAIDLTWLSDRLNLLQTAANQYEDSVVIDLRNNALPAQEIASVLGAIRLLSDGLINNAGQLILSGPRMGIINPADPNLAVLVARGWHGAYNAPSLAPIETNF